MQEAILDPTLFVKVSEDWCSERDANYWGGGTGHKSVYDPCPAGYKVLKNSAIYELERPVDGIDTTYGRYIYYDESENYCFFPYTGAIMNNAAMWYSGVVGYYPGSAELTDLSKMVTGFMWTDTEKTATMGKGLRYQAAVWQIEYDAGSKSHGLAVRCCKE